MNSPKVTISSRFLLALGIGSMLATSGCTDTMVIHESVPARFLGEGAHPIPDSDEYWIEIGAARIHIYVLNKITLTSQARVLGVKVEGSRLAHYELGSSPFVIDVVFDVDSGTAFTVETPVLVMNGKSLAGAALRPLSPSGSVDCINQTSGHYERISPGETFGNFSSDSESDRFCIRYEFPIDPIHPKKSFSVRFGNLNTDEGSDLLWIQFEGTKRTIRTSR